MSTIKIFANIYTGLKSSSAFSGGGTIDDFKQAGKQNYFMNLGQRSIMPKENKSSDDNNHNPPSTSGMQKIEEGTTVTTPDGETHDVNSDYGNYRIRLVPTSGTDRGLYLHGKNSFWTCRTHGIAHTLPMGQLPKGQA